MIPEIAELIKCSIEGCLEDEISISFSGGIDSTILASVASKNCTAHLFSCGTEKSQDMEYAGKIASELNLPLNKIILEENEVIALYEEVYKIVPVSLLKIGILVPLYACAKKAKEKGLEVMLFGSGSEELFIGYNRYYTYYEEGKELDSILKEEYKNLLKNGGDAGMVAKVCRKAGIEARFPFINKKLSDYVFSVPVEKRMEERELKKGLLREAGKLLRIPETAVQRKKKAAQYGSGVHKILMKHSKEINEKFSEKK
ncbi:asparagine synthase C-terminal domain-containing protein [Candidatus Micrarchaeota archaeon]|nr:asparagine synthase C-terminal domain-containing protein [Candidatus Micrarchaeota archaeon]